MPKGPQGQNRPADAIGNAVKVMRIATGEELKEKDTRNPAAVILQLSHRRLRGTERID